MMMRFKMVSGLALFAIPCAAHADLTAVYGMAAPNGPPFMTLEIAANGDIRGTMMSGGIAFIAHGGHAFVILKGADGPIVSRVEDVATATSEQIAKIRPDMRARIAEQAGALTLTLNGMRTVNGRTGDAYYIQQPDGTLSGQPWAVISHDPELAPLARAMADQFAMSMKLMGQAVPSAAFQPMLDVLQKGAPILMTGIQLQSVSDRPIPPSEFVLPAKPQTLDQVRQRGANGGMRVGS